MGDRAVPLASRAGPLDGLSARARLILRTIRQYGEPTRAMLIRDTGLSGVAVFRVTNRLAELGLIEIGQAVLQARGKPSNLVRLRADAIAVLGISVMTDHAEAVLMDFTGAIRAAAPVGVPGMRRDKVVQRVNRFLDTHLHRTGLERRNLIGAGLAIAGYFVGSPDAVNTAAELDNWALINLAAVVEPLLQLPVTVENIANAAAVGEQLLGAGRRHESFAYLNFAHGFGAGLIQRGRLQRGRFGNAGEVAALVQAAGLPSPTLGSLRQFLQADGMAFRSMDDMLSGLDPAAPAVERWLDAHAPSVSFVVNALRYLLDGDAVVLGGLLPAALADRLIGRMCWHDAVMPPRRGVGWPRPHLLRAEVTRHAAATGVAAMLLAHAFLDGP